MEVISGNLHLSLACRPQPLCLWGPGEQVFPWALGLDPNSTVDA